ncbi:MAG: VIT1/CCC1 transporter family protein [Candidatus Bathyarchaeota archaeon]
MLNIRESFREIRQYMNIAEVGEIARRYFIMNALDGALTVLGVIMGAYAAGLPEPNLIVSAGLGASLAMGISGAWGAYAAEDAERARSLKNLEKAMLTDLKKSIQYKASEFASLWVAFIDGVSPAMAAIIVIIPFFFSRIAIISPESAVIASITATITLLFILGAYLGKISKKNLVLQGFKMIAVGVVITIIFVLFRIMG